ncbi:MAG: [FeFe] hydrogenase H-cluster radical SAM maturase HydG [Deltaproteobacteria bacterium]|nr:[FeFe] hydrogenase H-cluster radical SAM maturase HydG [Deltaproteobacteria bacterium]
MIDAQRIQATLGETSIPDTSQVTEVLDKVSLLKGLTLEEAATLLSVDDPALLQRIYQKAREVKEKVFGKRIVLFAPLYLSNYCTNNCLYCGFRKDNQMAIRRTLTVEEVVGEASVLESKGFKRVLLVCGEDPVRSGVDYLISIIEAIYRDTGIRIIHINTPPMNVEDLRRLKTTGVGVYQIFQETYHRPTYETVHPSGRKKDYTYRLQVMDRAIEAGFEDVGIGALLGLYDYRFDVLATIAHSQYLFERFGFHAHTVSVPRLRPAPGSPIQQAPYPVSDEGFKKIVAVYRLALPSVGIVVSTREGMALRDEVVHIGASQISAGSRTDPGGYTEGVRAEKQFLTSDHRTLEDVIVSMAKGGLLPSLCTTCYRVGRTGPVFNKVTLRGGMERLCQANALLTLQEYIQDYARNGAGEVCKEAIVKELEGIKDEAIKKEVLNRLERIKEGERDLYL